MIEVSVPNNFGLNAAEIGKITKFEDLKNEVKRMWKLKKSKIVPVIGRATGMTMKPLTEYLKIISENITTNELQVEDFEKSPWNEAMRRKLHSLAHES